MDCRTAQILCDFHRPRAGDLEAADEIALEHHLATCPDCGQRHQAERRIDESLAHAMVRVDVPDRLHDHLLARLEIDRVDRARHRLGHLLRGALVAALLLLSIWGVWAYLKYREERNLTAVNVGQFVEDEKNKTRLTTSRELIESAYRARGMTVTLPSDLNYRMLRKDTSAEYRGRKVACLVFADGNNLAIVMVLPGNQFDLHDVKPEVDDAYGGCKVEFFKSASGNLAYFAVFNGSNLDWLRREPG